jgi:hypothetical protein
MTQFVQLFEGNISGRGPHLYGIVTSNGPKAHRLSQDEWELNPTHGQFFGDAWMRGMRWCYNGTSKELQFMSPPEDEEYFEIAHFLDNNGYSINKVVKLEGGGFRRYNPPEPEVLSEWIPTLIKESHLNTLLGDCRNEDLIDYIFGSVTDFARLIEEHGDEFSYEDITIKYDSDKDIHYFYKNEH